MRTMASRTARGLPEQDTTEGADWPLEPIAVEQTQSAARLEGKSCVVTGATSGIGYETARGLASMGARVIGVGRSVERCEAARAGIRAATENPDVSFEVADLSSQGEIRELAARIRRRAGRVDVLVNNAGVFAARRRLSPDGIEMQLAVNHLAPFLLTHELMSALEAAPAARVVTLSSGSHFGARLHWLDLGLGGPYHGLRAYAHSKLACILWSYEMARRVGQDSRISTYAVDPGLVNTEMGMKDSSPVVRLVWLLRRRQGSTPVEGARTTIYVASDPAVPLDSGRYWRGCAAVPSSPESYDTEGARRLWTLSERLTGIGLGDIGIRSKAASRG